MRIQKVYKVYYWYMVKQAFVHWPVQVVSEAHLVEVYMHWMIVQVHWLMVCVHCIEALIHLKWVHWHYRKSFPSAGYGYYAQQMLGSP